MKKRLLLLVMAVFMISITEVAVAQIQKAPIVTTTFEKIPNVPVFYLPQPNLKPVQQEDALRDKDGMMYRISVGTSTNITPENSGAWMTKPNGDKVWQLVVEYPGAKALSFMFSNFQLFGNSTIDVLDLNGTPLHKTYGAKDVLDHKQQNLSLCKGDKVILQLIEPKGTQKSQLEINEIFYAYRGVGGSVSEKINESDPCQVNVNCAPEGTDWQDEKRGVARILVVSPQGQGWCSGSVVNNVQLDCKPYFLTALHCGETSTTANFNNWRFYFGYESPNCSNPSVAGTLDDNFITGCVKLATSNDGGGNSGSDFLLVQMGTLANEATTIATLKSAPFNVYWNGWDANNTTTNAGTGIHHPSGDIKKISTFTSNLVSTQWGSATGSHWRVVWSATTNGHGVTEGGSSGSPIFKYNGGNSYIIGTLTGGSSFCTNTSAPDLYGKVSYHWTSNGAPSNEQLKTYLDPANTGTLVLSGSSDPCAIAATPVADFVGTPTTVNVGSNVQFSDLTSGVPDTWSWTITPGVAGVDWAYVSSTTSTSKNPTVQFNTVGLYTIALTASNSLGSDTETKIDYINVIQPSAPCDAMSSTGCATGDANEYIAEVTLNTISNATSCSTYSDFTAQSTDLTKGVSYNVTVNPGVAGSGAGSAYTDDEIAVWIDWNNDLDFDDPGENVGYVIVATGWSNVFNFTVPLTAVTGTVHMRVRISYQPDDGAIQPCGTSSWGEVEDYSINILAPFSSTLTLSCGSDMTVVASTDGSTMPDVTGSASASTDCPGGVVTLTQSPLAGSTLTPGANVVTVTAVDNCGSSETCQMTVNYIDDLGLNDLNALESIVIYPNPVSEELTIDLNSLTDISVTVYDATGKLIFENKNVSDSVLKLDMAAFAKGLYQIKITSNDLSVVRRISKM